MFQVLAPVTIQASAEARQALGAQLIPAGKAAWREIARRGQGLEFAHLQIRFADVTLAISSRLRGDGVIAIEIGLGDARQAARCQTAWKRDPLSAPNRGSDAVLVKVIDPRR